MVKSDDDKMLEIIVEEIDNTLMKWLTTYEMPGLNLSAIILARLTWLAKQCGYEDDFIRLLKAPEDILNQEDDTKVMH
jgi:hypothetical protein